MMGDDHDLLLRIDERVKAMQDDLESLKLNYVTRKEFVPVKSAVFGGVGFLCLSVVTVLVRYVVAR
jgi:hypothetical protein